METSRLQNSVDIMESLSEGDRAVLKTIFDPFQPLGPSDIPGFPVFQEVGKC